MFVARIPPSPAGQQRAPLRHPGVQQFVDPVAAFSCWSTAGSIAATSPPWTVIQRRTTSTGPKRPAPLRCVVVDRDHFEGVASTARSGRLHCGIPDRHAPGSAFVLLPPVNGGLHCGSNTRYSAAVETWACSRQSTAAPLRLRHRHGADVHRRLLPPVNGGLHCGNQIARMPRWPVEWSSRRSKRAPLRLDHGDRIAVQRRLLPPVHRRLHGGAVPNRALEIMASCSRRSKAGSIAACRRRRPSLGPASLLPPVHGGLHCGAFASIRSSRIFLIPRRLTAAPLRCLGQLDLQWLEDLCSRRSKAACIAVMPKPRKLWSARHDAATHRRWLHCGPVHDLAHTRKALLLPPVNGGLHCGPLRILLPDVAGARSRPSAAGSIAAAPTKFWRTPISACSRRSTAGTIAASMPGNQPGTRPSAPAGPRRALLRNARAGHGDHGVRPSPAGQRRALLRPVPVGRVGPIVGLLPPVHGGLHCGTALAFQPLSWFRLLPPVHGGLHCGRIG